MNKNNNKMDLLGNAPVPQALMALGIPIMIGMLYMRWHLKIQTDTLKLCSAMPF